MSQGGDCYICRDRADLDGLLQCPHCPRRYHSSCWLLSSRQSSQICPQCLRLCCRCWSSLEREVTCPRCDGLYHRKCEKLMEVYPGRQLCSLCIKELLQDRSGASEKFGHVEVEGRRYYLLKLRNVSLLHLSYVPESDCVSVPLSERFPPAAEVEKVLRWEQRCGRVMGLVKLRGRPEAEAEWESEVTIGALRPDLLQSREAVTPTPEVYTIDSSSSVPSSPEAPRAVANLSEYALQVVSMFGYDLLETERSSLYAFRRLKLSAKGITLRELLQEMQTLLTFVCAHLSEDSIQYGGRVIRPKVLFFRNLELAMIRKKVGEYHSSGDGTVSRSALYKSSFYHLDPWTSRDDILLLAAVLHAGYGDWKTLQTVMENLPQVHAVVSHVPAATVESFIESRVRFLAHCIILDEYREVVEHSASV